MIDKVILEMIRYFNKDIKRINHALKVLSFARIISELENTLPKEKKIIELAAILHDIGIIEAEKKYNSSIGKYQEIEGPPIVSKILVEANYESEVIERVCFIIGNHHNYDKIDYIDFQILVEADLLVNIFEENYNNKAIEALRKYFCTNYGKELLKILY